MRAVLLEVPEAMLAERYRLGLDGRDEVWNGVLHIVPPPGGPHQEAGGELFLVLGPLAKRQGLRPHYETGLGFYAELGVREMLIVHPEGRWVELLRAVGGRLLSVSADPEGGVRSDVLARLVARPCHAGRYRVDGGHGAAHRVAVPRRGHR
ncbi:MAG: hypothetical protein ACRDRU_29160 [Pseudonocardiaceae bacterium]